MPEANDAKPERNDEHMQRLVQKATENARAKNARLRHLKERNELYLAERKGEEEDATDEEQTKELRFPQR